MPPPPHPPTKFVTHSIRLFLFLSLLLSIIVHGKSVRLERDHVSLLKASSQTLSIPTLSPVLKRVHARCPCQFRLRVRFNAPPIDLHVIPNTRFPPSPNTPFESHIRNSPTSILSTFDALNRSALNAHRVDAFFRYHLLRIPIPISVTLLVRLSIVSSSTSSVSLPSRSPFSNTPSSMSQSASTLVSSVPASDSIHVHLVASARSARCPALLDQYPENDNEKSVRTDNHTAIPRVVGGDTSGNDIAKSMVYFLIRSRDGRTRACSGTLVAIRTVITAAHCGVDVKSSAYLGGRQGYPSSGKRYSISKVHVPSLFASLPENDFRRFYYDIAVVILSKDAPATSNFMLVNVNRSLPLPDSAVRVAGYGILAHDDMSSNKHSVLHHVDVPVVTEKTCRSIYAKNGVDVNYKYQVCAGYVGRGGCDSCQGDSGGPMFQYDQEGRPVLVGVVSIGVECADAQFPGVYVRISGHDDFLPAVGINRTWRTNPVYTSPEPLKMSPRTVIIIATASGLVALTILVSTIMLLSRRHANPTSPQEPQSRPQPHQTTGPALVII